MKAEWDVVFSAQHWLIEIEFNKWHRFDEIPDDLFEHVFGLIEERFRGWLYFFDDFDQSFYKTLPYKLNHYEINRENVFENQVRSEQRRAAKRRNRLPD